MKITQNIRLNKTKIKIQISSLYFSSFISEIIFLLLISNPLSCWSTGISTYILGDSIQIDDVRDKWLFNVSDGVDKVKRGVKRGVKRLQEVDTLYIQPNLYNYAAMVQNTNYWQKYRFTAEDNRGNHQQIEISPRSSFKIGPYFGWRWLFLGYTFDVGNIGKATQNTEFSLSLYSAKIGGDLVIIRNKSDFEIGNTKGFRGVNRNQLKGTPFNGLKAYSTMVNIYYIFNHRKFSYPAAYAQSTIQRISAGSFILGLRYDHHKIHFDYRQLPQSLLFTPGGNELLMDEMKMDKIHYYNASLSFGYSYNWVIARNLLLNLSLTPAIGYKKTKGEPWEKDVLIDDIKSFNIDFTSRAGLVWNNSKYYIGTSFINYIYGYNRGYFNLRNSISYLNFYVGFNFHQRK